MTFLCENYDREIPEKPLQNLNHTHDLGYKITRYTINNIKLAKVDKILNNYIAIHIKNNNISIINCRFELEFDNNFTTNIEMSYIHNIDSEKIINILLFVIKCHESMGYKFCCLNPMNISIIIDKCNITNENYVNNRMSMVERRININYSRYRQLVFLFHRNKNHLLVRKDSHRPF